MVDKKIQKLIVRAVFIMALLGSHPVLANVKQLNIVYLKLVASPTTTEGFDGVMLAINESNIAGKFLQQQFKLRHFEAEKPQNLLQQAQQLYRTGERFFIINGNESLLFQLDLWARDKDVLLFNINESSDRLRNDQCLPSVLHTIPSHQMKTDAIAQWLTKMKLMNVLRLKDPNNTSADLLAAFERSARRFGVNLIDADTKSGVRSDALFVSSVEQFNDDRLKMLPRVGAMGLSAFSWHLAIKKWGAVQLKSRFKHLAEREMNQVDFSGYLAGLTLSQAFFHVKSTDSTSLIAFIRSPQLVLAAYVGHPLTYRPWNGQLRLPMALVNGNMMVSQSPQRGSHHRENILDTLGVDRDNSSCVNKHGVFDES